MLVTGASRGIGRELALNYCRMGANVVITARNEKKLKEVRACVTVDGYIHQMWKIGNANRAVRESMCPAYT